ncbi:MFS transporter [Actinomadura kijaniata]|uniref:MFS family permease n=1 Tax=Actinomadura namibiensis TaxID=182080 RepID=A0A7W3LLU1_ACTNM|nr:MFS transporter [Actinomadura namibiensis]MBA8950510.1 MFS family permease [Actinomadura namibiensis]
MRASELRVIVRGRDFRRLYATRLTSQLTDGVFQAALAGYVFFSPERQESAAKAAAAFAVTLLPYSALGPFAGVFIDRWSRRRILTWAPVVRAALVLAVAATVVAGYEGAGFYLGVLLVLGVNRFFLAALSAALPHVVRREHLVTANAFAVTSGTIISFVGAGVGYALRLAFGAGRSGTALILVCAAALFLAAAAVATTLPRGRLGPHLDEAAEQTRRALGNVLHGLVDGARHMARRPQGALALGAISFHRFLYGIVLIMALLLSREHFAARVEDGLSVFAMLLGVSGAGFFVAALVTPPVVHRISKQAWITALLVTGAASMLLGLSFDRPPWALLMFLLGVVSQGVKLCADTILQETVDDAYRGRVFAVYDMLFNALFAAAVVLAAAALPADGTSVVALLAVAAAYAGGAVAYRAAAGRSGRVVTAG